MHLHASAHVEISPEGCGRGAASHQHMHTTLHVNLTPRGIKTHAAILLHVLAGRPTPTTRPTRNSPGRVPRRRPGFNFLTFTSSLVTRRFASSGLPPLRPLQPPQRASPAPSSPFFASDGSILAADASASGGLGGVLVCRTSAGIGWKAADASEPVRGVAAASQRRKGRLVDADRSRRLAVGQTSRAVVCR